jgi:anti-anti-sigma factor
MSISYKDAGELRTIVVSGRLDVDGTDSVAEKLVELTGEPKKGIVVDISSLKFLASIGIRALVSAAKGVKARGGKLVLVVDSSSPVMMSIKATGVDQLVPVFEDSDDAERAAAAA